MSSRHFEVGHGIVVVQKPLPDKKPSIKGRDEVSHKRTPAELIAIVRRVIAEADGSPSARPSISAARAWEIFREHALLWRDTKMAMEFDAFKQALRAACMTVED